jgi:hypothetical protein
MAVLKRNKQKCPDFSAKIEAGRSGKFGTGLFPTSVAYLFEFESGGGQTSKG